MKPILLEGTVAEHIPTAAELLAAATRAKAHLAAGDRGSASRILCPLLPHSNARRYQPGPHALLLVRLNQVLRRRLIEHNFPFAV